MKIISYPLAAFLLSGGSVVSLPQYAQKIPNGYSVPNPDIPGSVWAGVGHMDAAGGGDRNPFGLDFAANGHAWTEVLCQMDSDGDGRTNGEELGDPDCLWVEGDSKDPTGPALSHPGIPDEMGPAVSTHCDSYVTPEDTLTMDIGFSVPTQIDGTQTHYVCEQMLMDVPAQAMLHKIKHEVLLDNSNILHHAFVYICPEGLTSTDGDRVGQGSYECSGNESGCRRIGGWAVGPRESCEPPNVGVEIDFTESESNKVVVKIEAHYDNTSGQPQQDQSGIRIHMTPSLRPLTGSSLITGMATSDNDFLIPALQSSYSLSSICPTPITEKMEKPVYAYAFTPHMHYYGKSLVTEQYRCGQKIGEIGRINAYEFDNQQTYSLDPPIKILPGDSLVTTCVYDTSDVDFEVMGGEETTDEMCLNFLSLYPRPATANSPSLMANCFSFENGLVTPGGLEINQRVAIGDSDGQTLTRDFTSDPTANIGLCCEANNCEDLYIASEEAACGVSNDCMVDLICDNGICAAENSKPGLGKGSICGMPSDCLTGLDCVNGICENIPLENSRGILRSRLVYSGAIVAAFTFYLHLG